MLQILIGTDHIANRNEILRRVSLDVKNQKAGTILLVPELISHDMERRLCGCAGDTVSRFAEVLSFTRLLRRFCEETEQAALPCLDAGGRIVAMASATRQLHGHLKAYASVETKPEFLVELVNAVDEFKRCCVTVADLERASKLVGSGALAQKLVELALIMETYNGICENGMRDPRDQMSWLCSQMADSDYAERHRFYIDGFPDYSRQHMEIIRHLICNSDVTVSVCCDRIRSSGAAFESAGKTAADLLAMAKENNIPHEIIGIAPEDVPLKCLYIPIFQGETPNLGLGDRLQLSRRESVYAECASAAERIMELVRNGARYRDIAVVCTDMDRYASSLTMVLHRCNIPIYRSGTDSVTDQSAIFTVISAINAALGGFDLQDVIMYLRSAMSPLTLSDCDRLENYAVMWGISGKAWLTEWTHHPDGLNKQQTAQSDNVLRQLNAIREYAIAPLRELKDAFAQAHCMRDQVMALYRYLERVHFAQRLEQIGKSLENSGKGAQAQILNQLWEILLSALEQLYDVLGSTVWDSDTFARLLKLLLSQYKVGTIPPVLDAVIFGPCDAMRCQQCDHLILLGASEGLLPSYSGSAGLLNDQERTELRQNGLSLSGGAVDGVQAEFSDIYGVFCCARETVRVFCSEKEPSYLYKRLEKLSGGETVQKELLGAVLADPLEAGAYLLRFGKQDTAKALGIEDAYLLAKSHRTHDLGALTAETTGKLYGNKLYLSATQTDLLAKCKLAYFLKYGIRVQKQEEATIDPAQFGTYVHDVLEKTVRETMNLGGFHCISLEKVLEIAHRYSDTYIEEKFSDADSKWLRYLLQRNERELEMIVEELWNELQGSLFEPAGCEVGFGRKKELAGIPVDGAMLSADLEGYVDRVDVWQDGDRTYYRVVDYKTGKKDFDYRDVFSGIGMQMLLYLFALQDSGQSVIGEGSVPAGVLYFPARAPLVNVLTPDETVKERKKYWKRKGLLLDNDTVIHAMGTEQQLDRLCFSIKDGKCVGDLASTEQLKMLKKHVIQMLQKMVNEIASGNITPDPYTRGNDDNACTYCPYGAVCGYGDVEGRRKRKKMTANEFWTEIEKEVGVHGREAD